jgi:hypothetical protein
MVSRRSRPPRGMHRCFAPLLRQPLMGASHVRIPVGVASLRMLLPRPDVDFPERWQSIAIRSIDVSSVPVRRRRFPISRFLLFSWQWTRSNEPVGNVSISRPAHQSITICVRCERRASLCRTPASPRFASTGVRRTGASRQTGTAARRSVRAGPTAVRPGRIQAP